MKKIEVVLSNEDSNAVADSNIRAWYLSLKDGDLVFVANHLMMSALRHGVSQKEIAPFEFIFQGETITCDEKGELSSWPIGFMDEQGIYVKALMNGNTYETEKAAMAEFKDKHAQKKSHPFYEDKKVVHREYKLDAIKDHVNEYLKENNIAGDTYECTRIAEGTNDCMEVYLKRVGEDLYNDGEIDEDFEDDKQWKLFCKRTATKLGVRIFGAPWWYYPK